MPNHLIATETLHVGTDDGTPRTIYAGSTLEASDPIVKHNPDSFKTAEELADSTPAAHRATGPDDGPAFGPDGAPVATASPATAPAEVQSDAGPLTTESVPTDGAKRTRKSS